MGRKRKSKQQIKKLYHKCCFFCGETDYGLLDVHRIYEGSRGGTYDSRNTLVNCANCHRKVHGKRIIIHGKYFSTSGKWKVNYTEDGNDYWKDE